MQVTLTPELERMVAEAMEAGGYDSAEAVLAAALSALREDEQRLEELRAAIAEGRDSGEPVPYDPEDIKGLGREMLAERRRSA